MRASMLAVPILAVAFATEVSAFAPHHALVLGGTQRAAVSVSYAKRPPAFARAAAVRLAPQMALTPKQGAKTWVDR